MSFLPPDERIPGVYQEHKLQRQAGELQLSQKVLLIGARATGATATDLVPIKILSRGASQAAFGSGSQLDLMVRQALASGRLSRGDSPPGGTPELWAMPVAPVTGGTAATQTVTFTGGPATNASVILYIQDHRVEFGVIVGDTVTDIATKCVAAIGEVEADLAYTAASALGVVTLTAREQGAWGDELFMSLDTSAVNAVGGTVAAGVAGAGVLTLTSALDETLNASYDAVVLPQSDGPTQTAVVAHIAAAWDYTEQRYQYLVLGVHGTLATATAAAAAIDDWRVTVTSNEKIAGGGAVYDFDQSGRSHSFEDAAAYGARLFSQSRANFNFNGASLSTAGRPRTVARANVNDAINAGVTVILAGEDGTASAEVVDPVTTAITDQLGGATSDTRWQPAEIVKVAQVISRSIQVELDGTERTIASETELATARAAAFDVLATAGEANLIDTPVAADVTGVYETAGATTTLVMTVNYAVIVGIDLVAVTHNITRSQG